MRVSTSMLFGSKSLTHGRLQSEGLKLQEQIATGRRVSSLGDDPGDVTRTLRGESVLRETKARRRSVDEAEALLQHSEATLTEARHLSERVHELTVQFANSTYNASDRREAAEEIGQIRERMAEIANRQVDGRYLFGGRASAGAPFDTTTGAFTGDTEVLEIPVARGARIEATLPGGEPFAPPAPGQNGFFDTLDDLEAALRADDGVAISALADETRALGDRIDDGLQRIGHRYDRLSTVKDALDSVELSTEAALSAVRDTDISEAVFRLRQNEAQMQAALQMTGRITELSLTNYLR